MIEVCSKIKLRFARGKVFAELRRRSPRFQLRYPTALPGSHLKPRNKAVR